MTTRHNLRGIPDDGSMESLWARFEGQKMLDNHRQVFLEELLHRYEYLGKKLDEEREGHQRERDWNRGAIAREKALSDELHKYNSLMEANSFVLVLIDGDGILFHDSFLQDGERGGRRAAGFLHQAVSQFINATLSSISGDAKIVVRIYTNAKRLGQTYTAKGYIPSPSVFRDFGRGFTGANALFDLIDAGDSVTGKVTELLKLHMDVPHCRHVLLGGLQDKAYTKILQDFSTNQAYKGGITLIEGTPVEQDDVRLQFPTVVFEPLFRNTRLGIPRRMKSFLDELPQENSDAISPARSATPSGCTPTSTRPASRNFDFLSPTRHSLYERSSNTSSALLPEFATPPTTTWASLASQSASLPLTCALPKKDSTPSTGTLRNKQGYRLDPPLLKKYNEDEVNRIKDMKLCNKHYLLAEGCELPARKCKNDHTYKIKGKTEIESLKVVARMQPCHFGTGCEDPSCIYGHCCPVVKTRPGGIRSQSCLWGEGCRFPPEMHGMDMNPVKATNIK